MATVGQIIETMNTVRTELFEETTSLMNDTTAMLANPEDYSRLAQSLEGLSTLLAFASQEAADKAAELAAKKKEVYYMFTDVPDASGLYDVLVSS